MKPQEETRAEWLAREIFKAFPNDCPGLKIYELDCGCIYYRRVFRDGREDEQLGIYRNPRDGLCEVCMSLPKEWAHRVESLRHCCGASVPPDLCGERIAPIFRLDTKLTEEGHSLDGEGYEKVYGPLLLGFRWP